MTHPAMYNHIKPYPLNPEEAKSYLAGDEWPICDHNIDCVLNRDLKGLMTNSDIADAEAEAAAERKDRAFHEGE